MTWCKDTDYINGDIGDCPLSKDVLSKNKKELEVKKLSSTPKKNN